jgi:hypothetical protein
MIEVSIIEAEQCETVTEDLAGDKGGQQTIRTAGKSEVVRMKRAQLQLFVCELCCCLWV